MAQTGERRRAGGGAAVTPGVGEATGREEVPPAVLVVMGVAGTGKTYIGTALAARLGWRFQEGDNLHSPENVEKMRAGIPLTDEDRWPWLHSIAAVIDRWRAEGERGVVTCSALKRAYRRIIIGDRPDVRLVYLTGPERLIAERIGARRDHAYMPSSLLPSQLAALEPPDADERPVTVSVEHSAEVIADQVVAALGLSAPGPHWPVRADAEGAPSVS